MMENRKMDQEHVIEADGIRLKKLSPEVSAPEDSAKKDIEISLKLPSAGQSDWQELPPEPVKPVKKSAGVMKRTNYTAGCLIYLIIGIAVIILAGYFVRQNFDQLNALRKKFERFMSDHNLAHDGGDAPWKAGGKAE